MRLQMIERARKLTEKRFPVFEILSQEWFVNCERDWLQEVF